MIRISEDVRSTHSQDGGTVLEIRSGRMFGLNSVGSKIIELLRQGCSSAVIAQEIARTFGISPEVADQDVREFLETLEKHQLLDASVMDAAL